MTITVNAADTKQLARMLRSKDPVTWLVAADMIEDGGNGDRAEALRLRARRVIEVAEMLFEVASSGKELVHTHVSLAHLDDGCNLIISGRTKEFTVWISRRGKRSSHILHMQRKALASREDYRIKRAADLVDSIVLQGFDQ